MELKDISGIGEKTLSILAKHSITTVDELIHHFPRSYCTYIQSSAKDAQIGEWVSLTGTISRPISKHTSHTTTQLATFRDNSGSLTLRWFNSPFIVRSINPSSIYQVRGQLTIFGNTRQIVSPNLSLVTSHLSLDSIVPIYPALSSLKSGNLRKIIASSLAVLPQIPDSLPPKIRQKYNLIDLDSAMHIIHSPPTRLHLEGAIHRLAFDELYDLQLTSKQNSELNKVKTTPLHWNTGSLTHWLSDLPYNLTSAQNRVISEIITDLQQPIAMHRLLAGEVGSGKTLVAATASYASYLSGKRTLVMAPTQILAEQLYNSFHDFMGSSLKVSLITASQKGDTQADIIIGTQALLSPKYKFTNIGLVVVDEQHKFGVKQREYLASLSDSPHVLMMTATPIPRTLAMTIFSSLDISRLDELPKDRLPIKTYIVSEEKRDKAYAWIKSEVISHNNQVFVVVPLIEEAEDDETTPVKSIKLLESDLKNRFPDLTVDIMHGKMKENEKNDHLRAFRLGLTQILVATSMVEVGIDIPNANIIVVEDAERFGLAQLHQLRGRVGRGGKQGYCLIFSNSSSQIAKDRLNYFAKITIGEELAKYDLDHRGPGELFGQSQHGFFDLQFASIYDTELLKETHEAVRI